MKSSSDKFYKFLQKILNVFNLVAKSFAKTYLNTVVGQGTLKKVVNWLVDNAYDQSVKPMLEILLVRVGYAYDVREGKIFIERLKEARESGNAQDWNTTVDDINN